jgi:hypothetical protein
MQFLCVVQPGLQVFRLKERHVAINLIIQPFCPPVGDELRYLLPDYIIKPSRCKIRHVNLLYFAKVPFTNITLKECRKAIV